MQSAAFALLLVVLVNIGPEMMPGSFAAWDYVFHGIEAFVLWSVVALLSRANKLMLAVCVYAAGESLLRPVCRLMHDMTKAPKLNGGGLCSAAGFDFMWLTPVAAGLIAYALADKWGSK